MVGSLGGGKRTGTNKTVNTVQYAPFVENAQKTGLSFAGAMAAPHMQVPSAVRAGLNEDQLMSAQMARDTAKGVFNTDLTGGVADAAKQGAELLQGQMGRTADPASIAEAMNPELEGVVKNSLSDLRREHMNAQAMLDAQTANEQAFGGSGNRLARARLARGYTDKAGDLSAQLRSQAFDNARRYVEGNIGRDANLAGKTAAFGLQGARATDATYGDTVDRQIQAQGLLANSGGQLQQQAQANLDIPWTMLQRYMQYVPGFQPTKTQQEPIYSNPLGSALGAASAFGLFGG